ncbi:hypothetical protein [Brevibacillus reuszeri]|uniref:hypothetical protein n=1 Tax=Brevibacillus reuszeri TaxID=54915 RepID=UPI000CCC80C6|nr:hypothetical protein [Brevibacillus reuszeri]
MFDKTFGTIVGLSLGLVFLFVMLVNGVSVGGFELGQKTAVQYSTIETDPMNGMSNVPVMPAGSSSVNIVR